MAFNGFQITPEFLKQLQQYIGGQNVQQLKPNQVPANFIQDSFTNSGAYKLANPDMSGNQVSNDQSIRENYVTLDGKNPVQSNDPLEALGSTNWTGALIGAGAGIINELLGGEDEIVKQNQKES